MGSESKSRVIYENLDTTFVNLWALLRNLSQRGFIGRIRVELKDYTADVFMTGSRSPLVHAVDHAAGTDTLEEGALHRLVLRAREAPGTISVFEGADEAVAVQGGGAGVRPVNHAQDTRATDDSAEGSESELPLSHSAPVPAPFSEPAPADEGEWGAIVEAGGELISGVERALTSVNADFDSLFRAVRIELADDYTFLDPMSDGFRYENSAVTLRGELPTESYVAGLSEALRRVVDRVATGERARRVRERVALELFSVARKRKETLSRSGFLAQLDRLAGTKVI